VLEKHALATAGRTQNNECLSGVRLDVDASENALRAEALPQPGDLYDTST
jgi:hypothetical protein